MATIATRPVELQYQVSPWLLVLPLGLALALLPPFLSVGLLIGLVGGAVVMARPRWALYGVALTVPYQSMVEIKVVQVSVTVTEAAIGLLLVAWLTQVALGRAPRPRMSPLVVSVLVLLMALALTVFVATDLTLAAKEMLKWIELATVYLAGVSLLETAGQRLALIGWLVGASASEALLGLYQSITRHGPEHFMIGGVLMRAYGTFEQPNPFAGFLGFTLPIVVAVFLFGLPKGRVRQAAGAVACLLGAAVLLTLSRGAWAGQGLALLLVVMIGSRTARHRLLTFGALGCILLAAMWPVLPSEISGRLASVVTSAVDLGHLQDAAVTPENWAVMERLSQWYAGWQMFASNPLLGVGIGNYNAAYDNYRLDAWPVALGHAHNHYLTIAAEAGVIGLAAYLGFLIVSLRAAAKAILLAPDRLARAAAIGILGSLAAFATHNMFDVLFVHGMGVTIGLLLSLVERLPAGLGTALLPAETSLKWKR